MRSFLGIILGMHIALATSASERLIQVAPASQGTMRLATTSKENDPLHQAAKRAAADPSPDASMLRLIESVRMQDEHQWERAFSADMSQAFRQDAAEVSVPFEYAPNPYSVPDGFGVVQLLANAVLRAQLPCSSIHTVDSLINDRGWILVCDQRANAYTIMLVGNHWKLNVLTPRRTQ